MLSQVSDGSSSAYTRGRSRSRSSTRMPRSRSRSRSSNIAYRRMRVPSYLRVRGTKAFQMTATPFCLILGQGTAATQGINFYPLNGVPAAPVYNNTSIWALNFMLSGVNTIVNGVTVGTASFPNVAEYTSLFDSYRIRKVEISMYYQSNSSSLGPQVSLPNISMVNDYDDSASTPLQSLQQYDSYRVIQFGNNSNNGCVKHVVYPKVETVVNTTGGTTLSLQMSRPWLDCATNNAIYYGVKGNYDNFNVASANIGFITFYVKYYVEFKNSR